LHVSNVEKALGHPVTSKTMKEFTLEWNLMHVNNVGKPSIGPVALDHMNKFIVITKPIYTVTWKSFYYF
jgi:hypothetical protein